MKRKQILIGMAIGCILCLPMISYGEEEIGDGWKSGDFYIAKNSSGFELMSKGGDTPTITTAQGKTQCLSQRADLEKPKSAFIDVTFGKGFSWYAPPNPPPSPYSLEIKVTSVVTCNTSPYRDLTAIEKAGKASASGSIELTKAPGFPCNFSGGVSAGVNNEAEYENYDPPHPERPVRNKSLTDSDHWFVIPTLLPSGTVHQDWALWFKCKTNSSVDSLGMVQSLPPDEELPLPDPVTIYVEKACTAKSVTQVSVKTLSYSGVYR